MTDGAFHFNFDGAGSNVYVRKTLPTLDDVSAGAGGAPSSARILFVCDANTLPFAREISAGRAVCILPPGEGAKTWASVKKILAAAKNASFGRDCVFCGIGGGVVTDITAFAASIYMRGVKLSLVPTTLLGMIDASVGGKTAINISGVKNFAGTFYPALNIYMPLDALETLPQREIKSGLAEVIKAAVLETSTESKITPPLFAGLRAVLKKNNSGPLGGIKKIPKELIEGAVRLKGGIVQSDPRETGTARALLNLGHTFGHALEASCGLGVLTHGEAVAWGIIRACELGMSTGVTPSARAAEIISLIKDFGYETAVRHPAMRGIPSFTRALSHDKKNTPDGLTFIVPGKSGAVSVTIKGKIKPFVDSFFNGRLS